MRYAPRLRNILNSQTRRGGRYGISRGVSHGVIGLAGESACGKEKAGPGLGRLKIGALVEQALGVVDHCNGGRIGSSAWTGEHVPAIRAEIALDDLQRIAYAARNPGADLFAQLQRKESAGDLPGADLLIEGMPGWLTVGALVVADRHHEAVASWILGEFLD